MGGTTTFDPHFPPPASVGVAEEMVFHYISDEELEMLVQEKSETMMQIFWACIGICAGSAQGAVMALTSYTDVQVRSTADLVPLLCFAGAAPLGVVAVWEARRRQKRIRKMQDKIRARHKVRAAAGPVLDYVPDAAE